jgi:hypothetical protein
MSLQSSYDVKMARAEAVDREDCQTRRASGRLVWCAALNGINAFVLKMGTAFVQLAHKPHPHFFVFLQTADLYATVISIANL